MEKAIPNWRKHHKEQGFGSKVKIPKTTEALRENQIFSQENTCWWDLLVRSVQPESLEQVPEFTKEQQAAKGMLFPVHPLFATATPRQQLSPATTTLDPWGSRDLHGR